MFNFHNRRNLKPVCPTCQSTTTRKIITNANIIFKGKGFTKGNEYKE